MPIDNPVLLAFCNETVRPTSDKVAALLPLPDVILAAAAGKGLSAILGTTDAKLMQPTPWADADYAAIPQDSIVGTDSGARTLLTNWDVIGFLRVMVALNGMIDTHPTLPGLIGKIAVNPRA
mgnify:CR=1 FL=1